jgi:hypothetical protein
VTTYDAGSIEATAHLNRDPFLEGIRQCIREGQRLDGATFTATAKLDTRQAEVAARQLQLLLDRLGATDIDLQVSSRQVDQAAAQVAALRAELARLQREQDKTTGGAVRGSQQRTQQLQKERHELGLMRVAVEQLGPPLIAAGGGAVALGASFAGLALAGVTAFLGVKDAIAQADAQGQMFGGQLNVLKTDLAGVSQASATAIAPGFLQAVDKLHAGVPAVQASLTGLSSTLGDIAQHLAGGLIGGFTQFSGVMQTGADVIDRWAAGFERWATGPGGTAFAHALLVDLQHLVPFLDAAGPALAHLVQKPVTASASACSTTSPACWTSSTGWTRRCCRPSQRPISRSARRWRSPPRSTPRRRRSSGTPRRRQSRAAPVGCGAPPVRRACWAGSLPVAPRRCGYSGRWR